MTFFLPISDDTLDSILSELGAERPSGLCSPAGALLAEVAARQDRRRSAALTTAAMAGALIVGLTGGALAPAAFAVDSPSFDSPMALAPSTLLGAGT